LQESCQLSFTCRKDHCARSPTDSASPVVAGPFLAGVCSSAQQAGLVWRGSWGLLLLGHIYVQCLVRCGGAVGCVTGLGQVVGSCTTGQHTGYNGSAKMQPQKRAYTISDLPMACCLGLAVQSEKPGPGTTAVACSPATATAARTRHAVLRMVIVLIYALMPRAHTAFLLHARCWSRSVYQMRNL
jgi:hypothetical protein